MTNASIQRDTTTRPFYASLPCPRPIRHQLHYTCSLFFLKYYTFIDYYSSEMRVCVYTCVVIVARTLSVLSQ